MCSAESSGEAGVGNLKTELYYCVRHCQQFNGAQRFLDFTEGDAGTVWKDERFWRKLKKSCLLFELISSTEWWHLSFSRVLHQVWSSSINGDRIVVTQLAHKVSVLVQASHKVQVSQQPQYISWNNPSQCQPVSPDGSTKYPSQIQLANIILGTPFKFV